MQSPWYLCAYYRVPFAAQGFPITFMGKTFVVYYVWFSLVKCNLVNIRILLQNAYLPLDCSANREIKLGISLFISVHFLVCLIIEHMNLWHSLVWNIELEKLDFSIYISNLNFYRLQQAKKSGSSNTILQSRLPYFLI